MKRVLVLLCFAGLIFATCHQPAAKWKGMPAPHDPEQTDHSVPTPFRDGDNVIVPLALYKIEAVVLSRERYRFDPGAPIAPVDLALGWGPMSIASVINELKISQGGRFYEYRWSNEPPLDPGLIVNHSANTHCLPANDRVRRELLSVHRHDWVHLEGYLVEVQGDDGSHWRSSLTREDSGGGACEVMWVTDVSSHSL